MIGRVETANPTLPSRTNDYILKNVELMPTVRVELMTTY